MKSPIYWFAACAAVFLAGGLYSGERIFFIGLIVILSTMFYAAASNLWVLVDFKYLQKITPEKAVKGEKAVMEIQIHNDKPFIYPCIKIFYQTPEYALTGMEKEKMVSIIPFKHQSITEEFTCRFRGKYLLGITRVQVSDIFGLFTFSLNLLDRAYHKQLSLTVHPRILNIRHLPLILCQEESNYRQQLSVTEEPSSISEIKQYSYGDPVKKIHWKISSKLQDLYVKKHETTTQPQTVLYLETHPCEYESLIKYQVEDQIIECATAITHYVLNKWLPIRITAYNKGKQEIRGRTPQCFNDIYNYLALLPFNSPYSISEILSIDTSETTYGGNIILVAHNLNHEFFNKLCIYKQYGLNPMLFLVQHREKESQDIVQMVEELNNNSIPSFLVYNDQRIDKELEVLL